MKTEDKIAEIYDRLKAQSIRKNIEYGDSLQNGVKVFSKSGNEGILGRLDDKLSRIARAGVNDATKDTIEDLVGYLVHLLIRMEDGKEGIQGSNVPECRNI